MGCSQRKATSSKCLKLKNFMLQNASKTCTSVPQNGLVNILLILDKEQIYHLQPKKSRCICAKLNYA
jgi:hypothetical protein